MGTEVRVPRLPESVTEAVVGDWHKKPGDRVQRDETLLDLETDKVVLDVPSPSAGILREVKKEKGAIVGSEEVLGIIESAGEAEEETAQKSSPKSTLPSKEAEAEKMPPLSPAVRRLVREHRLDPREIPATGRNGRLTKADVVQFLQAEEEPMAAPPPPSPTESRAPEAKPAPAPREEGYGVRREAMSRLRQRIAERMLESQQTTATLSTFNEVNMQGIMELRRRHRNAFEERYGVRLGFMSFFIKACIEAFKRYPVVNAAVQDDDILYYHYYHIGIAVATPRGLVVPVLRDADQLSFADIEIQIMDFAERARNGRLTIEELSGGTFTITNGGVFGSLLSTPILNPPQSAILGMHKIEDRPVAENGEVKIRPMMYVALSYDHRLIDGKGAVQFLVAVKEALEDPVRLLLEV